LIGKSKPTKRIPQNAPVTMKYPPLYTDHIYNPD
jgi:hypothetical protein